MFIRLLQGRFFSGLLNAASALMAVTPVWAAQIELLPTFGDFALREPEDPPLPGGPRTYSATGSAPTWFVSQWNIAGGKLAPLVARSHGDTATFDTRAAAADVEVARTPSGVKVLLGQDGAVVPCWNAAGEPRESDLFISSNVIAMPPAYMTGRSMPLDQLRALVQTVTLSVQAGQARTRKDCKVNKTGTVVALILHNVLSRQQQTLFYQLTLSRFCGGTGRSLVPQRLGNHTSSFGRTRSAWMINCRCSASNGSPSERRVR